MALIDVFKRRTGRKPAERLSLAAPESSVETPLAPDWRGYAGPSIAELASAAKQDVEAASARRRGVGRELFSAQRDVASPPGPRRDAFDASLRRLRLGPISDARSLRPPIAPICEIDAHFGGVRQQGAGFRIGRHLVLTAAHLLKRPDLGPAEALALNFHNGADRPLTPLDTRVSPGWKERIEAGEPPRLEDDYAVIFVAAPHEDIGAPFPYLPLHAVSTAWFARRIAARYRLAAALADPASAGAEPHRFYEASGFAKPELSPLLGAMLEQSGPGAKNRFQHNCVRHSIRAPKGFSGAPLLASFHDPERDSVYDAAVGVHLGSTDDLEAPFGVARIIDEELKRRLLVWSREAQALIAALK